MVGSNWVPYGWELKAIVQVHVSLTQSDVDCFCSSPLPVSTHPSLWHRPSRWLVGIGGHELLSHSSGAPVSLPACAPQFLLSGYASFPQCRIGGTTCREPHRTPLVFSSGMQFLTFIRVCLSVFVGMKAACFLDIATSNVCMCNNHPSHSACIGIAFINQLLLFNFYSRIRILQCTLS